MTTVISVWGKDRAALLADPNFEYVGRRCAGWAGSVFANPFKVGREGPAEICLHHFATMLETAGLRAVGIPVQCEPFPLYRSLFAAMWRILPTLRGKTLGCWCCEYDGVSEPMPLCHAAVLARLVNGLEVKLPVLPRNPTLAKLADEVPGP